MTYNDRETSGGNVRESLGDGSVVVKTEIVVYNQTDQKLELYLTLQVRLEKPKKISCNTNPLGSITHIVSKEQHQIIR